MLIIIRGSRLKEIVIEGAVFKYFDKKAFLRVKNSTNDSVEFIFELSRSQYNRSSKNNKTITEKIYELGDIEYVNVITQSDEIS